jgi:dsDNA-specific endonuclease/ATPase MutS2
MQFKTGDLVEVLDDDFSGEVIFVNGNMVSIQTDDGFELEFLASQLVKIPKKKLLESANIDLEGIDKIRSDISPSMKKSISVKPKERTKPAMEIDLHIHQLLPSTKGMQKHDILTYQLDTVKRQLAFAMSKKIQRVVFIHGVGEGVLKLEMEYLLKQYDNLKFYDANYQKYGLGATEVYIFQNKK